MPGVPGRTGEARRARGLPDPGTGRGPRRRMGHPPAGRPERIYLRHAGAGPEGRLSYEPQLQGQMPAVQEAASLSGEAADEGRPADDDPHGPGMGGSGSGRGGRPAGAGRGNSLLRRDDAVRRDDHHGGRRARLHHGIREHPGDVHNDHGEARPGPAAADDPGLRARAGKHAGGQVSLH